MFMEQIRRFAAEILPALQAYKVAHVPLAEEVPASAARTTLDMDTLGSTS
jgi:hypothetical protein